MSREHKSRREILDAVKNLPSIAQLLETHGDHYKHELDIEVNIYGRNYNGKKVGPYLRLLTYEPGETIVREGDWGGNTFYIVVKGNTDVFVTTPDGAEQKVAELTPGTQFGEMSVLGGVPRSATVKAPATQPAQILEIQRPALRLLRKLEEFGKTLDKTYRAHGRNATLQDLSMVANLSPDLINELRSASIFRVYSKNHVLFNQNAEIDRIYLIREGWLRRSVRNGAAEQEDFLGKGFCFGLEAITKNARWPYTVTLLGRAEILEISIKKVRESVALRNALSGELAQYAPPPFQGAVAQYKPAVREKILAAQEELIETGLVDGGNLLVMDMDLCVRCGNCSLACHKIHGQSRLLRRGVHVTRLEKPKLSAVQSVLSPSVCMHCKDPECLTGCPTGAIGRFGGGEVDINPKTCIGCGDCATQCPYNAITMIPRKPKATADATKTWAWKIKDLLRLSPDPLPPEVDTTEDLVAVKCNLCSDRETLNPKGAKTRAYSCEENCPTGALARINPDTYFTEIGSIEGMVRIDQTHAVGRNIHKSDPPRTLTHILGVILTVFFTGLTLMGFERYGMGERIVSFLNMRWVTGIVGLIGIAVVMAYPVRRQIYTRRAGPLRVWLLTHLYAGIIAGIMLLLHGGKDSGGALTTALMISFDLVILTGIFGIFCYWFAPRMLTKIEGAPLLLDDLKARREELLHDIAEIASQPSQPLRDLVRNKIVPRFVNFGYLLRQYTKREDMGAMIEAAKREFEGEADRLGQEMLRHHLKRDGLEAYFETAMQAVRQPQSEGRTMTLMGLAAYQGGEKVRLAVNEARKERNRVLRAAESAATLRRVDALIYLHRLLKVWLPPHVITTSLMLALMIVHIIQVIYYAAR
ncbi:MAG TPA: cyclic nucleotide-binding domain-containing protein [Blastocatellia bacterium]|nr:cyclic nucleotide-binding domain-containing protein [Blastocatellia bacterium]